MSFCLQAVRFPGTGLCPRVAYQPPPGDLDTEVQPPALEIDSPASTLPPYLHGLHTMMQAAMCATEDARRAARDRVARRMQQMFDNAWRGHAPTSKSFPMSMDGPPPSPFPREPPESTLQ
eukprot:6894203-Pyramimonas_sp.AAC.1